MSYTIAAWNIEKNGQSSTDIKQEKVSDFLAKCCSFNISVIFLCEVHSARVTNYLTYCISVYGGEYEIKSFDGGYSNNYILLYRKDNAVEVSQETLLWLNRKIIVVSLFGKFHLCLAHFKSGQTGLTKNQLEAASSFLDGAYPGVWGITGDMNWDYANVGGLKVPSGSHHATCWTDSSQKSGGILDWCLVGSKMKVNAVDVSGLFPPETYDMTGPDHKPVIFSFDFV